MKSKTDGIVTKELQAGASLHFFFSFTLGGLDSDLLVILLESGKILSGLGELSFLHTLTDVPMHEGSLGVHEIELVIDSREDLGDGGRGARRRRRQVEHAGARAAQVLLLRVDHVDERLRAARARVRGIRRSNSHATVHTAEYSNYNYVQLGSP